MSKINLQQIGDNVIEVTIPSDTPMEMVHQLTKSFISKGLVEDLKKSTLSTRYFYRPQDSVNATADRLIKSLKNMAGEEELDKSNYGKFKGGSQYNQADNAKRKMSNVGDVAGQGPNVNVKSYSTKPGQMSAKAQSDIAARKQAVLNRKQPVKRFSPEEIARMNQERGMKKNAGELDWSQEDLDKVATNFARAMSEKLVKGTEVGAQLSSMYNNKMKLQPTDEELFGHLVVPEQEINKAEANFSNSINNFYAEASKPISQRFKSEEEELAYWNSIKVEGGSDDQSGY